MKCKNTFKKIITKYCCDALTYQLGSLLASQRSGVVSLIPLPVREAVNEDDAVLHQGLGSDQLVVGGIVDHVDDPGLACAACAQKRAISLKNINKFDLPNFSYLLALGNVTVSKFFSSQKLCLSPYSSEQNGIKTCESISHPIKFKVMLTAYTQIPMRSCRHRASEHGTSCSHHGPSPCGCDEVQSLGKILKRYQNIVQLCLHCFVHTHL